MTFQRRAEEFGALATALRASGYARSPHRRRALPDVRLSASARALPGHRQRRASRRRDHARRAVRAPVERRSRSRHPRARPSPRGRQRSSPEPRPLLADLDALPFPKRVGEPQLHLGIPAAFLVGSRGCYGHCTFCCIHAYLKDAGGERYRERSAENLADEIAELRRERGARMFVFHDDDFFTRDHERDLAPRDAAARRAASGAA